MSDEDRSETQETAADAPKLETAETIDIATPRPTGQVFYNSASGHQTMQTDDHEANAE